MQRSPKTLAAAFFRYLRPQGESALNEAMKELELLSKVISSLKIVGVFKNPLMQPEEKEKVLEKISSALQIHENAKKILLQILKMNELVNFSRIINACKNLRMNEFGTGEGLMLSGCELTESQQKAAEEIIKKMGRFKEVLIRKKVNPAIIGGLILKADDKLLDLSIQRQLRNMIKIVS